MIQVQLKPDRIVTDKTCSVTLQITNIGDAAVYKTFLAVQFSSGIDFLTGSRRVTIETLKPGETHTEEYQLRAKDEGSYLLTSNNFSYRVGGISKRISDLQVPLTVTKQPAETVSQPTAIPHSHLVSSSPSNPKVVSEPLRVFISYSRSDAGFAQRIAHSLNMNGAIVWFDQTSILAGRNWSTEVQKGLDTSDLMIVIITQESMESPNVEDEWQYFLDEGKPLIPLLLRPARMHFQLRRLQYIDFSKNPYEIAIQQLWEHLTHLRLGRQGTETITAGTTPPRAKSESKIGILFLAANPVHTQRLRLDEEIREIDQRLLATKFRDQFEIHQAWAVRYSDLSQAIQRYVPQIIHFSGHGSNQDGIILEDINGNAHPVSPQSLARLFGVFKDTIRCVVLNACWSASQAQAILEHVMCVIGMSRAIGDQAAIRFASGFYQAIGYGHTVKAAFELGCIEIDLASLNESDVPKLLVSNDSVSESIRFA